MSNMAYTLHFISSKCSLSHNSNVFGSCIIHILYTGCAKKVIPSWHFDLVVRSSGMCYIQETYVILVKFVIVLPLLRIRLGVEGYFFTRTHSLSVGLPWLLPIQHAIFTRDELPCLRWDWNPQSQHARDSLSTPQIAQPLGSA